MERPTSERIERYRQEMMAMYRQRVTEPSFDEQYPPPNLQQDMAAMTEEKPLEEVPPHVGYLQVFVFTGGEAQPLEGARVLVTRPEGDSERLYANAQTDRSGLTPVIPLPSVDPSLTLDPATDTVPYVGYDVQVSALGYRPVLYENVPVYGGNGVTQPAALTPLTAGDNGDIRRVYRNGGPNGL